FAKECRSLRDNRNKDNPRRTVLVEVSTSNALVSQSDAVGSYDWSFQADEEPTNYALMAYASTGSSSSSGSDNEVAPCSKACSKAYATLQSHYDKLALESVEARLVVYQQNENVFEEDIKLLKLDVISESNDSVPTSPMHDRYKSDEGYHAVPPPYTGTFMPLKPDLVFNDAPNANETITNVVNVESSSHKPSKDMSKPLRPDAPIIEDWTFDSKDESEIESVPKQKKLSFVLTTEHVKTPRASVKPVEHPKQAKNLMTDNQKSRGHKNSWNRKACFVCKSLNHLIKDCDYYEKQMVQKPVWNNAMRINHHNSTRMTHPYSNRNVVPTAVLTRSGLVSLNVSRPISTAVPQTTMKSTRSVKHVVHKAHSPIRRPINHIPTTKTSNFNQKVTTVKVNKVTVVQGTKGNWVWKLKCTVLDHVSKLTSASMTLKKFDYTDALGRSNGCSRYMTRNISFLSDFEEFRGGYVAFGGNPKGGKISSIDTECVVLSSDYKLPDENHVLLRVPRENNMYNVDLKNVV
nr:ribonuclease H-like domain-containing protein [Tanacetum cinerariifolium]